MTSIEKLNVLNKLENDALWTLDIESMESLNRIARSVRALICRKPGMAAQVLNAGVEVER